MVSDGHTAPPHFSRRPSSLHSIPQTGGFAPEFVVLLKFLLVPTLHAQRSPHDARHSAWATQGQTAWKTQSGPAFIRWAWVRRAPDVGPSAAHVVWRRPRQKVGLPQTQGRKTGRNSLLTEERVSSETEEPKMGTPPCVCVCVCVCGAPGGHL